MAEVIFDTDDAMPGVQIRGEKYGRHWHVSGWRDDWRATAVADSYDAGLRMIYNAYLERDGWPLGPERLDPHRTVAPAAWRGPIEPRPLPPSACKTAGQPAPFVFDPMQDLDRALARAKAARRQAFETAGRWLADHWQQTVALAVFGLIVGALFVVYGHWDTRLWLEAIQ